jgi:16S rRNA (guanine966-N2)-methyltransferase
MATNHRPRNYVESMASNEVRIIGGKWRGRKLVFPDLPDLRPTLGRVRETLFNWLRNDVAGSRCLDLFAGSGALGFEALSRGAASVTFVDASRQAIRALAANAQRLDALESVRLRCARAEREIARDPGPYDLVFIDPPFRDGSAEAALTRLRDAGVLAEDALIYVEIPRREPFPDPGWTRLKHATAGDTQFGLLASP